MATLRKWNNIFRPNKVSRSAPQKRSQYDASFGFVFSDNIERWIASGQVTSKEYKNAKPVF